MLFLYYVNLKKPMFEIHRKTIFLQITFNDVTIYRETYCVFAIRVYELCIKRTIIYFLCTEVFVLLLSSLLYWSLLILVKLVLTRANENPKLCLGKGNLVQLRYYSTN